MNTAASALVIVGVAMVVVSGVAVLRALRRRWGRMQ
jgi:hypothetical protein